MNTDTFTNDSGMLNVGNGHSIWWHDWGNRTSKDIIFYLHGGPGSNCKDKNKLNFDPATQRVIFHDQRGSGQSVPFGTTEHNTTQDLVNDIEALRGMLNIDKILLTGGSWGSCLALAYAIAHPDRVTKMLLGGIFLGDKTEIDYIVQGGLRTHYPESWEQFIELVPKEHHDNTTAYYLQKFTSNDDDVMEHVRRWCLLEGSALSIDGDYKRDEQGSYDVDGRSRTLATLEAHYFINNCFLPENYILANAHTLRHIPTILMQGRHDHVCPPETAYALHAAMGNNCHLHLMPGSHASESVTREVLRAYSFAFLRNK
jgi:proline iminopeptidase